MAVTERPAPVATMFGARGLQVSLRLQVRGAITARPPVVVVTGDLLEGEVRVGGRITVPLLDGGALDRVVIGVLPGRPDRSVESVSAADGYEWVGIAFERRGDHRADDIALGVLSDAEPPFVLSHLNKSSEGGCV